MDKIFEKKYSIELPKLSLGSQTEEFQVDEEFFDNFEHSPIHKGEVNFKTLIIKYNTHLDVTFQLKGFIVLECDRCLEEYPHQVKAEYRVIYTYDEKSEVDSDDVVLIDKKEPLLFLGNDLYDFIILEIPIRKVPLPSVHKCPPEVLALINNVALGDTEEDEEDIDPRWNDLKKLKDK